MRTVFSLLKLQIDNKTDLLKTATPKTMLPALFKNIVVLILTTLVFNFALSRVFGAGFLINAELLSLVLVITQMISVAFAVGNVINTLYLCHDNQMLICLPVKPNQLFVSKLLMIYITEVAVNTKITLPLFLTLGMFSRIGLSFYLSIPILLLLLPIFPIVAAAFLSIPIMAIIRFLKKHSLLSIIVILATVASCLWVYLTVIGGIAEDFQIAEKQYETVRQMNKLIAAVGAKIPIYYQLGLAMTAFSRWYYFLLFILICAIVSVLTILFTRYFFFKIAMKSLENSVKSKKREKEFKKSTTLASLFKKELYCVFRSPSDVFESFLFTLLMPFIVFSYDKLLMSITVNQAGVNMIAGAHVMVVAILAMLSNISSSSAISRDGNNFYVSKIIPVNYYTQIFAKFTFNAVFTFGALLVTAFISSFTYPLWQIALGTLAVAMAAIGHIAYSIDTDIKNPTVNMQGDESNATVSKSTPKSLIYGLMIGFALGITVILMSSLKNQLLPYLVINAAAFVFMIYRVYTLVLRINLCYDKIEM